MSKINNIQKVIAELDGASFQKLIDSYLAKKGFANVNCIGSVFGKNKVRQGTPDTLIALPNGNYVFIECATNEEKRLHLKFQDDLSKCLDETKTGIKTSQIEQILLCHNSRLSVNEISSLRKICLEHQVLVNILGLSELSYEILERYPGLAKDHLGINVDTGQIVDLETFVDLHDKNKLTTSIQTRFGFREQDKAQLIENIHGTEITLVNGGPGVGKTRLAVECIKELADVNTTIKALCVFNRGVDIFEDCQSYFADDGEYLILIDDCNRLSGFQYFLHLLKTQRKTQSFRIIATVRDYAVNGIREMVREYGDVAELNLHSFSTHKLKNLLSKNTRYITFAIKIAL